MVKQCWHLCCTLYQCHSLTLACAPPLRTKMSPLVVVRGCSTPNKNVPIANRVMIEKKSKCRDLLDVSVGLSASGWPVSTDVKVLWPSKRCGECASRSSQPAVLHLAKKSVTAVELLHIMKFKGAFSVYLQVKSELPSCNYISCNLSHPFKQSLKSLNTS